MIETTEEMDGGYRQSLAEDTDPGMGQLADLMEEFDERVPPAMVHARVWQFGLAAGMTPREIAGAITSLVDQPEDNINLVEAITAYALWGNRELNDDDHFLGSVEFNAWRGVVEGLKGEGHSPEDIADAVRHDFETAAGLHDCSGSGSLSWVDNLREAK